MKLFFSLLMLTVLTFTTAQADDAELYDKPIPANAALVRVVNAASGVVEAPATVSSFGFGKVKYAAITNYKIVNEGDVTATIGGVSQKIALKAGNYYTAVLTNDLKIVLLQDALISNPAKARIYFYNLSDAASASVFAPEHKTAIIAGVAKNAANSKEINAFKLNIQVKAADAVLKEFANVQLKRRVGVTFLLIGSKGKYTVKMLENVVDR